MKALAVDVERNLRSPLVGIGHAASRLGFPMPEVNVAIRSGDTSAADRRLFARRPSDVLITTPESLFLILTSKARESLSGLETVILDEIHAVAGTKRGAHLMLSLERLDALLDKPAQRVGLSATVRPVEEISRFLSGGRPVTVVQPSSTKKWDLQVVVPIPTCLHWARQLQTATERQTVRSHAPPSGHMSRNASSTWSPTSLDVGLRQLPASGRAPDGSSQ